MAVRIILVPYDAGHRGVHMGRGPEHLAENGLTNTLASVGCEEDVRVVELEEGFRGEVAAAFELDRLISGEVRSSIEAGKFPLVVSGNCNSCVGTVAGARKEELGVLWFDGHPDFQTPETTTSGFTDNMGLSIIVGDCWSQMSATVPGYAPVSDENVVLVGCREIEPGERERLRASNVKVIGAEVPEDASLPLDLDSILVRLRERVQAVYLHLDLDVLDPNEVGRANEFAPADRLTVEQVERALRLTREHVTIAAAGIASYDPATDPNGTVLTAGVRLAKSLVD